MTVERLTLADMYQKAPTELTAGVVKTLQDESPLLDTLSFKTVKATTVRGWRSGELREVQWRRVNEEFGSVVQGRPTPVDFGMFSFGNTIDIDYLIKEDTSPTVVDPEANQIASTVEAMARQYNDYFINNDPMTDADGITGLKHMISTEFSGQQVVAGSDGASVLDLSPSGANYATNIGIFFRKLDAAMAMIHGKKPSFAICNDSFLTAFRAICRDSGYLKTTEDSLGREFLDYNGCKFIDAGYKVDDSTKIITDKELYTGVYDAGSGTATSIYFIRQDDEHFQPFQFEPLTTDKVGLLENRTQYRTVIKWDVGASVIHPRSICRLKGIKLG